MILKLCNMSYFKFIYQQTFSEKSVSLERTVKLCVTYTHSNIINVNMKVTLFFGEFFLLDILMFFNKSEFFTQTN